MLEVNSYFDGKVKSIALQTKTLPATVGVMAVGEYEFATHKKETMTIVSGQLIVKLPGQDEWVTYAQGNQFIVDAHQTFQLKVNEETAYFCTYE
ncbi:pyrimidine/purine nucleoside phosphorylase [Vibrio sp. PP-XX7]